MNAVTSQRNSIFVNALDGLRGLSSQLIFLFHVIGGSITGGFFLGEGKTNFIVELLYTGKHSTMFFSISGFVIFASLTRNHDLKSFFIKRATRIYPLFLAIQIPLFLVAPLIGHKLFVDISVADYITLFISNLFFLPGIFELPIVQIVAWTLSYELLFYLLSGTFFYTKRKNNELLKKVTYLFLICLSLFLVYRYERMIYFVIGISGFYLQSHLKKNVFLTSFYSIFYLLATLVCYKFELNSLGVVFFALTFFSILTDADSILKRLLNSPLLQYFGKISYSFYLIHAVVMFGTKRFIAGSLLEYLTNGQAMVIFGVSSYLISLFLAHLSYELIEKRTTKYLRARFV